MGFRDELCQSPSNDGVVIPGRSSSRSSTHTSAALEERSKIPRSPTLHSTSRKSHPNSEQYKEARRERSRRRIERLKNKQKQAEEKEEKVEKQEEKRSRRVRFEIDDNSNVVTRSIDSEAKLGERERRCLWWTEDEADMMDERTERIAESYKEEKAHVESFVRLFSSCAQAKEGTPLPYNDDVYRLVQTSARGLEVSMLNILRRYRARHVEAILNAQDQMPNSMSLGEKWRRLSELSQKYSRAGSVFAQVLARTDAESVSSAS